MDIIEMLTKNAKTCNLFSENRVRKKFLNPYIRETMRRIISLITIIKSFSNIKTIISWHTN
ncbi:hypothetical protein SAMN05444267_100861 [Chryseobacterium polytrichastri]|uniref:Uncharacterized protein n=1 Tax=Chryseobacterium polytrichastri TaxID=1302687 RepID=A0A1M6VKW2_9FLAO|nr:hypothetical protein SAMN05444267_100861 [Chryseobacterium polytrichastri]